jgi:hypothetical protein
VMTKYTEFLKQCLIRIKPGKMMHLDYRVVRTKL